MTPVKSGLMLIEQKRCHVRILYEHFMGVYEKRSSVTQRRLYPERMELNPSDFNLLREMLPEIKKTGFEIELKEERVVEIHGVPAETGYTEIKELIERCLSEYQNLKNFEATHRQQVALSLAKAASINNGRSLAYEEMQVLVDKLFACSEPNYTPDGEKIISLIKTEEIEKLF